MKVLHVIAALNHSGAASVVHHLADEAARCEVDADIVSVKPPGNGREWFSRFEPTYLDVTSRYDLGSAARWLSRILVTGRYDFVHTHLALDHVAVGIARFIGRWNGRTKWISTIQNERMDNLLVGLAYGAPGWQADSYVCVSYAALRRLKALRLIRRRADARTIHNAVDIERFRPVDPSSVNRSHRERSECRLVCVAYFRKQKDHITLLAALRKLDSSCADVPWRLDVVGDGEGLERFQSKLDHSGLRHRVQLLGFRPDVESILRQSDAFVLSTHFEGTPLAVLEALASGLPVVASSVGGVPEILRDGLEGFLVAPGNPSQLASCLQRLIREPALRKRMGECGRETVKTAFSKRQLADRYLALYKELSRGAKPRFRNSTSCSK